MQLHYDNRSHEAENVEHKIKQLGYKTLPHLQYSSELFPTDLLKHLDNFISGKKYSDVGNVKNALVVFL